MNAFKVSWKRSKLFTILTLIQYLIAFFFVYATFVFPSPELKVATGSLALVLASIASADFKNALDAQKIDQILTKLDEIEKAQANRSSVACSIEAGLDILSRITTEKRKAR